MGQYTQGAYERLVRRREQLDELHKQALLSLGSSADDGNNTWHDNFGFEQAKRDVETSKVRLDEVTLLLNEAVIVPKPEDGTVGVGCDIVYRFDGDDEDRFAHIAGDRAIRFESDERQQLSIQSPFGSAILGARVGDVVSYTAPSGRTFKVTLREID
jgi:transcription elongation factor GreA